MVVLLGVGCAADDNVDPSFVACDVGTLCLQESQNEGGVYGVAQITAHYAGMQTYELMNGDTVSCPKMVVGTANDRRVMQEIGTMFTIPDDQLVRVEHTTAEAPASFTIYITERVGKGTSPCSRRVHILN